ncbi:MAG TPA: CocE/NonD family hydrolase [Chthoniobacterales bacterium]
MARYHATLTLAAALMAAAAFPRVAAAQSSGEVGPGYDIEMSRMIAMRDGLELEAWIFRPSNLRGKAPAVLELTQYDIDGGRQQDFKTFVQRGYVFVQVEVRGRGRSGGEKSDNLGLQVGRDGRDLVEWIAAQPWSDGHVVMYGGSFVGMTQWRTAAQIPPHLSGIAPYVPIYPGWDVPNSNGIPESWSAVILGFVAGRTLNTDFMASDYWRKKMLEHYAQQGSFRTLDEAIGIPQHDWWMVDARGQKLSFMKMWLDHVGDEAFNLAAEPKPADFAKMKFPVFTATGFFDDDQPGALHYYSRYSQSAPAKEVSDLRLLIGPWDHTGTQHPIKTINGLPIPENAVLDMNKLHADWYDWVLGRGPKPTLLNDRVTYYMMGANEWRSAHTLEDASSGKQLALYLDDRRGTPKGLADPGVLSATQPGAEPPATMVSDPRTLPELAVAKNLADEDLLSQFRAGEKDALVFQSTALPQDREVAGQMHLDLIVQSDAPDFDLWAQVQMVKPDGSAVTLGTDIRRARFRDGFFKEELLKPDQVVTIPFAFNWLAWRIPAGARLRLVLMPLNSPNYQKNYNTGGRIGYENPKDARVAHIKLFHDNSRASVLSLPLAAVQSGADGKNSESR